VCVCGRVAESRNKEFSVSETERLREREQEGLFVVVVPLGNLFCRASG